MTGVADAVRTYVEVRLKGRVDELEIAGRLGYSPAHMRALFATEAGVPFKKYVTRRRVANAAFDILYTQSSLLDIAFEYEYDNYDTFARAFRRVTGCTPKEFRDMRPRMERRRLGGGIFGVDMARTRKEGDSDMANKKVFENGVTLYGVPRVHFGAFGGITPYPIALKACANYMGEDIDYADAITGCGAAFRLTWDTTEWNGGNVDVCHTFDESDPMKVYVCGMTALGRAYRALERKPDTGKALMQAFMKEALDAGAPVVAMGIVGPPEAGLVTGYRDGGDTLLGWSVFQEYESASLKFDESGYYITDKWWENGVDTLIVMGESVMPVISPKAVAERAVEVMKPRTDGQYRKGLAAYDAWISDLDDDSNFKDSLDMRLMCQDDAVDCLSDGRHNASLYFSRHADESEHFKNAADAFAKVRDCALSMFTVIGGWERGEKQMKALAERSARDKLIELIKQVKEADERAYSELQKVR